MEIFSAALSLLAIFVCSIIVLPILLLVVLFFGYDSMSPQVQKIFKGLLDIIRKALNLPVLRETTKATSSKTKSKQSNKSKANEVEKPKNVEDAEFREIAK